DASTNQHLPTGRPSRGRRRRRVEGGVMTTAREIRAGRRMFHFTGLISLPQILREGISKGEVPISPTDLRLAPNLTTSHRAESQFWTCGSVVDKTKARLAVDIPDGDQRLEAWPALIRRCNGPKWYHRRLDPRGQGKFWFVFWGVIPPEWIGAVELRGQ